MGTQSEEITVRKREAPFAEHTELLLERTRRHESISFGRLVARSHQSFQGRPLLHHRICLSATCIEICSGNPRETGLEKIPDKGELFQSPLDSAANACVGFSSRTRPDRARARPGEHGLAHRSRQYRGAPILARDGRYGSSSRFGRMDRSVSKYDVSFGSPQPPPGRAEAIMSQLGEYTKKLWRNSFRIFSSC